MWWRSPLLFTLCVNTAAAEFIICSFNVQNFNSKKASNYKVIHTLTRVLSRCDITLLQHVVDPDGEVITALMRSLNSRASDRYDDASHYDSVSSRQLGVTDQQKYVFIYRVQTVNVTAQYQYQGTRAFSRPPFVIHVQSNKTAIRKFVLVPLHSAPDQVVQEIDWLYDVFMEVNRKWNNSNVMFLGDFHASCAYLTKTSRKHIRLYKNSTFSWLIGDKVDTTVSEDTHCAYDRIVVHGEPFLKTIKPFSAEVFDIGKEFKLTKTKVMDVSDHHPLRVTLKSAAPLRALHLWLPLAVCVMLRPLLVTL